MPDRVPEGMPERMPEDVPDRMPEDMPDKMSEDLPVRKCINGMVGITRSKVILMDFMRDFHIYHLYITYILYNYIFIYLFTNLEYAYPFQLRMGF